MANAASVRNERSQVTRGKVEERENGLSSHKYIPVSHVYHIKVDKHLHLRINIFSDTHTHHDIINTRQVRSYEMDNIRIIVIIFYTLNEAIFNNIPTYIQKEWCKQLILVIKYTMQVK